MNRSQRQIALASGLRRSQTDAEKALWARLRNKQLEGVKFRRQQLLDPYIVDFVSFERKIVSPSPNLSHQGRGTLNAFEPFTVQVKEPLA